MYLESSNPQYCRNTKSIYFLFLKQKVLIETTRSKIADIMENFNVIISHGTI